MTNRDMQTTATSKPLALFSGAEDFAEIHKRAYALVQSGQWNPVTDKWDGELPARKDCEIALAASRKLEVPMGEMDLLAAAKALMLMFPNVDKWDTRRRSEYIGTVARALRKCPASAVRDVTDPLACPFKGYMPPSAPDVAEWAKLQHAKVRAVRWRAEQAIRQHDLTVTVNPVPMERRHEIMEEVGGIVAEASRKLKGKAA